MSIDYSSVSRSGDFANAALRDELAKMDEINLLDMKDKLSGTNEHAGQIAQDEKAIDHDERVVKANQNITELLVTEQKVQQEAHRRAQEREAELKAQALTDAQHQQQPGQLVPVSASAVTA